MEIRKTYRYRLYRSKRDKHLVRQIELASEIWNHFVALTRRYYSLYGKYPGYYKLKRHLAKLKKRGKGRWYGLNSQAGQNVIERLDKSYQRLFKGGGGRPGFKKRMKRLWGRKVSDLGFHRFVSILEHRARANGKQVVKVDRFYPSTKTCNDCGSVADGLTLADRVWVCHECGTEHDRDLNAAKNIRDRALSHSVGDVRHARHAVAV